DRRRQLERRSGRHCALREGDLVFVDVTDRYDAWQDRRLRAGNVEEPVAHETAGAPGRQIERGARECERVAPWRKPGDQPTVKQRADQGRDERRRSRDGEDAGVSHGGSYTGSAGLQNAGRKTNAPVKAIRLRPMSRPATTRRWQRARPRRP